MRSRTLKVFLMLVAVVTVMVSFSVAVSAASKPVKYITTPRYMTVSEIRYTSVAKDITDGEVVTHYAVDSADNWVYFNQEKVTGATRDVTFVYYGPEATLDADMRFGDEVNNENPYATLRDIDGSSPYKYITEGLHVHIYVNGTETGKEAVVPEQEPGLVLTRVLNVEGGLNSIIPASDKIASVTFDQSAIDATNAVGAPVAVTNYTLSDSAITLADTNLIVNHGILNITTEPITQISVDFDRYAYDNTGTYGAGTPDYIDFLAKYNATEEYEYGVVIAESTTTVDLTALNTDGNVLDASLVNDDRSTITKLGNGTETIVAFKAEAKNSDNEFAVTVEELIDYLKPDVEYTVYAYIKLADEFKLIESVAGYMENGAYTGEMAKYNTVKFKLDTEGNCIRVLN